LDVAEKRRPLDGRIRTRSPDGKEIELRVSSLPTAFGEKTRLLELGVPDYLIKATLIGVLAQRLVRTLCPHCKAPVAMTLEQWRELGVGDVIPARATPHRQVGCLECRQTGYLGRTGVYELMPVTGPLRAALGANTDRPNCGARQHATLAFVACDGRGKSGPRSYFRGRGDRAHTGPTTRRVTAIT
jgi:type II secretory ATPase GspE/PulE/Tfp pilus assembly ATPase PilB-like protein